MTARACPSGGEEARGVRCMKLCAQQATQMIVPEFDEVGIEIVALRIKTDDVDVSF